MKRMNISVVLQDYMGNHNISATKLSEIIGLDGTTMIQLISGHTGLLSGKTFARVVNWLFTLEDEEKMPKPPSRKISEMTPKVNPRRPRESHESARLRKIVNIPSEVSHEE